ncbi:MAG: helix-turn-helix domain-containing protein [Candidatus Methylomirabilales bacterium]
MSQPAPVREATLSLEDAAAELGIKVSTLRNWIWLKKIGSIKAGRVRIPVSEVLRIKRKGWRPADPAREEQAA